MVITGANDQRGIGPGLSRRRQATSGRAVARQSVLVRDYFKSLGISLIPATAPDFFIEDTPTAVLVRQVLGAIAQFEKTSLVAKLKAARDRNKAATGKCGGRKSYAEARPLLA
jgi:DNA invertase Pin-like site-specific DNA recombinase